MAQFTRKYLTSIGIEEDKIDLIMEKHSEVVTEIKDERDKYKVEADKLPDIQKQLNELQEEAKNNPEDKYKVKYDALKEDFEEYKKGVTAKETKSKKESAYTKLLKAAGVSEKRISAILKVTNFDDIDLDENGDAKDADKLTESIKSEWADFISTTSTQGANVANPPANNTSKSIKTKKEIMEIKDTAERQQAWKDYLTSNQKGN
jgi:hypothetical protein